MRDARSTNQDKSIGLLYHGCWRSILGTLLDVATRKSGERPKMSPYNYLWLHLLLLATVPWSVNDRSH